MSKQKIIFAVLLAALVGFVGWWWWKRRPVNPAVALPPVATLAGGTGGSLGGVAPTTLFSIPTFKAAVTQTTSNYLKAMNLQAYS